MPHKWIRHRLTEQVIAGSSPAGVIYIRLAPMQTDNLLKFENRLIIKDYLFILIGHTILCFGVI